MAECMSPGCTGAGWTSRLSTKLCSGRADASRRPVPRPLFHFEPHASTAGAAALTSLDGYTRHDFLTDLFAGVIVGIVALPLAIAFGIASRVTPAQGLYTAIIGGLIIAALGGSRVQIGGPTGAFVVIVYGIVQQFGYDGLAVATLMAGVILIGMGLARLGAAIKFIPYPVTLGFTAGIALIIAMQQVKDVLGLRMSAVPANFLEKLAA